VIKVVFLKEIKIFAKTITSQNKEEMRRKAESCDIKR
jgi:hypothetical protein